MLTIVLNVGTLMHIHEKLQLKHCLSIVFQTDGSNSGYVQLVGSFVLVNISNFQ